MIEEKKGILVCHAGPCAQECTPHTLSRLSRSPPLFVILVRHESEGTDNGKPGKVTDMRTTDKTWEGADRTRVKGETPGGLGAKVRYLRGSA